MRLFNTMVKGIITYEIKIWGWKNQKELEKIKEKYIKCILKLERKTLSYMPMLNTKENKLETDRKKVCKVGKTYSKKGKVIRKDMLGKGEKKRRRGEVKS